VKRDEKSIGVSSLGSFPADRRRRKPDCKFEPTGISLDRCELDIVMLA
jgi:hypothetical protein